MFLESIVINKMKEGNVLFTDAINTFYLLLYDIKYMVKDNTQSKRGNQQPPLYELLFPISSKGHFLYKVPQTG